MDVEMEISNLTENNGEKIIKETLNVINGIHHIEVNMSHEIVKVSYDQEEVSLKRICQLLEEQGYVIKN